MLLNFPNLWILMGHCVTILLELKDSFQAGYDAGSTKNCKSLQKVFECYLTLMMIDLLYP